MPAKLIERLQEVSGAQVEAVRRGRLGELESLETERRALALRLEGDALARLAADEPDFVGEAFRRILENDRLVKAALQEGLKTRSEAMAGVDQRRRAERAYRGASPGSR